MEAQAANDISIHALREEGDRAEQAHRAEHRISIHALREEGDGGLRVLSEKKLISIHALREEGDIAYALIGSALMLFLSTPSARRATRLE